MAAKVVFFDVANTLLHKPGLYPAMLRALRAHGANVPARLLLERHRLLSEAVMFPDRTSRHFYDEFNAHLLRSLGIAPTDPLLDGLFSACSYLPWEVFPDTDQLDSLALPIGILSNWDASLQERLSMLGRIRPLWIFGSSQQRLRKPDPAFFRLAIDATGVPPADIAVVGDSLRLDIEPALRLGMQAFLIDRDDLYPTATVQRIRHFGELRALL
jgi:FMN phosphatase YigB (HAD superfamily)